MHAMVRKSVGILLFLLILPVGAGGAIEKRLNIGVALHSYYSWVVNIVGDKAHVQTIIPSGVDPHSYQPQPQDLENIINLDVVIVNGLGHDDYVEQMLGAAGREDIISIKPNSGVPLIPAHNKKYKFQQDGSGHEKISYNSHSYISILSAIQQINTIAGELGRLQPQHADFYHKTARQYARSLRHMLKRTLEKINAKGNRELRIASVHDGYAYLFQELGIKVSAVIQPRHGIEPSAKQLADTIRRIKRSGVNVLFAEMDYQKKYVKTIFDETGCRVYKLSHISNGPFTPQRFTEEMQKNLDTIVLALANE